MALGYSLVKSSRSKLSRSVYIRSALQQCVYFLNICASGSDIERTLTKEAYLVHIRQIDPTECTQVIVLVTL